MHDSATLGRVPMTERAIEWVVVVLYAIAAISGGLGGCAAAGHHVLRGQQPRISYVLAYGIIGMVFGVLVFAYGNTFGADVSSLERLIGHSVLAGAIGSAVLASSNISARWVLKRLGIEVVVTVKRKGEDG